MTLRNTSLISNSCYVIVELANQSFSCWHYAADIAFM